MQTNQDKIDLKIVTSVIDDTNIEIDALLANLESDMNLLWTEKANHFQEWN